MLLCPRPDILTSSGWGKGPSRELGGDLPAKAQSHGGGEGPRTGILGWSALTSPSQEPWAGQPNSFCLQSAHVNHSPLGGAQTVRCRSSGSWGGRHLLKSHRSQVEAGPGLESRCPGYPDPGVQKDAPATGHLRTQGSQVECRSLGSGVPRGWMHLRKLGH